MKYIALTIGPIYKTLQNAKKPKELFSSSYIFSYIMRNIIKEFRDREFVTPYIKDDSIFDENSEVGLFHDRFIFKAKENDIYKLKSVIEEVLKDVAYKLDVSYKDVREYMQINFLEKELDEDKNPILELNPYLDTKELFYQVSNNNVFISSLRRKEGAKDNFLTDGKNIIDNLEKLSYHKYYCIVHADGDNMSNTIEDKDNIDNVSKNLFEYCKMSNKLIRNFGGQTIFAGGDDLLFFAPVVDNMEEKTIFNLCDEISKDFETRYDGISTLSFGVTINYIKFPLYEALENSRKMLFEKAKMNNKNNIAFKVTKHSGQSFEAIIHRGNKKVYDNFVNFTSNIKSKKNMDNFLHSIHHKIDTHKITINQIAGSKDRLKNFFDNYFNKNEHNEYSSFFENLIDFIYEVYQDVNIEQKEKINIIYSTLRFIKFVKGAK